MCFVSGSVPVVRSVDMMLVHNSDKVKLVCRVKADRQLHTEIFWRRDGARLAETRGKIRIRQKRTKSVLTLARVEAGDSGEYSCVARNSRGEDTKMTRVKIQSRSTTASTTTTTTAATTTQQIAQFGNTVGSQIDGTVTLAPGRSVWRWWSTGSGRAGTG